MQTMIVKHQFQLYKFLVNKLSSYQIVKLPNCQVTKLLVTKLLVTKILVTKLLVTKMLVTKLLFTNNPPIIVRPIKLWNFKTKLTPVRFLVFMIMKHRNCTVFIKTNFTNKGRFSS